MTASPVVPVCIYKIPVPVIPPQHFQINAVRCQLNVAWGHEDGNANVADPETGEIISEDDEEDEEFVKAHVELGKHTSRYMYVQVYKNGSKVLVAEKPDSSWKEIPMGVYVPKKSRKGKR